MKKSDLLKAIFLKKVLPLSLAASLALSTTGCQINKKKSNNQQTIEISECLDYYDYATKVLAINGINVSENDKFPGLYNVNSIDLTKYSEKNQLEFTIDTIKSVRFDKKITNEEFENYTGVHDVTWKTVEDSINNNKNIHQKIKDILIKGIHNLEKKGYNYNLSVLNYNMKNIKIEIDNNPENKYTAGTFNAFTKKVTISKYMLDVADFDMFICHELLGHGSNSGVIEVNGEIIYSSIAPIVVSLKENAKPSFRSQSASIDEAIADIISSDATNKKIKDYEGYQALVYSYILLSKLIGIDINNYISKGLDYLVDTSSNENIDYNTIINILDREVQFYYYPGYYTQPDKEGSSYGPILDSIISDIISHKDYSIDDINDLVVDIRNRASDIIDYTNDCYQAYNSNGIKEYINKESALNNIKSYQSLKKSLH